MVGLERADPPRRAEIELRAVDRLAAHRELALFVHQDPRGRGHLQNALVDQTRPRRQIRVLPRPERARRAAGVPRPRLHGQAVVGQRVVDRDLEQEGPPGHRMQADRHHHPV